MYLLCFEFVFTKVNSIPNPLAKEELNLLAKLMGGLEVQKPSNTDSGFRVNLFATDEEEEYVFILRVLQCFDQNTELFIKCTDTYSSTGLISLKEQ